MKRLFLSVAFSFIAVCAQAEDTPDLTASSEQKQINIIEDELNFDNETIDAFGNEIYIRPQVIPQNAQSTISSKANNRSVKLNTRKSLTDNLKENSEENDEKDGVQNWLDSGYDILKGLTGKKEDSDNPLSNMLEESKGRNTRSNVSVFDIAGVMLRMTYKQAEEALSKRGYKKISQKMDIPNFIKWRNEETCRNNGIVGYERLNNCVIQLARKSNNEYIAQVSFNKFDTKESVNIFLTSNFTGNKIYKVTYRTEAGNLTGNSPKALYLRNIKIYDFWKKINQKYGVPDNKQDVIWGMGGNKPYMKAITGALLLEDTMLKELDYTRMSREDQRFMNTDLYTF